ncbi:transcriptional regulator [Vibrio sp. MarTm2]|uniref:transcriptional regulator n=1 Tax=Vibrio sp. MarTm2 TaxID=2998831 RepID=UPI0022CD8B4B|nr:transcriptional regulator [Vibrio sp. MarTm2]MDA0128323.1 transcriptional regulator [Vibrio sp. MarTm2]
MHIGPDFLLAAIRQKIRDEGLCYCALSDKTGVPLSTIKRHLHNPALGLDKILMYTTHLNTNLVELSTLAIQIQRDNEQFLSDEQNALFVEYPYLLDFIYLVTSCNRSPKEIAQEYQLSDTSLRFYLSIAEILGYMENHGDKIFYRSGRRFIMEEGTELDTLFKRRFEQISMADDTVSQVCQARVRLTAEQRLKLEQEIDQKISEMHAANCANETGELTNVMLRSVPGQQIFFADTLPEITGELLKEVSARFRRQ